MSSRRLAILALFFLSGAASLVYQVAWVRMLVPTLGMSVWAVSTVLTAFMAGLALGAAGFGRLVDRTGRGLRLYGWLEIGIAGSALLLPVALGGSKASTPRSTARPADPRWRSERCASSPSSPCCWFPPP